MQLPRKYLIRELMTWDSRKFLILKYTWLECTLLKKVITGKYITIKLLFPAMDKRLKKPPFEVNYQPGISLFGVWEVRDFHFREIVGTLLWESWEPCLNCHLTLLSFVFPSCWYWRRHYSCTRSWFLQMYNRFIADSKNFSLKWSRFVYQIISVWKR